MASQSLPSKHNGSLGSVLYCELIFFAVCFVRASVNYAYKHIKSNKVRICCLNITNLLQAKNVRQSTQLFFLLIVITTRSITTLYSVISKLCEEAIFAIENLVTFVWMIVCGMHYTMSLANRFFANVTLVNFVLFFVTKKTTIIINDWSSHCTFKVDVEGGDLPQIIYKEEHTTRSEIYRKQRIKTLGNSENQSRTDRDIA